MRKFDLFINVCKTRKEHNSLNRIQALSIAVASFSQERLNSSAGMSEASAKSGIEFLDPCFGVLECVLTGLPCD